MPHVKSEDRITYNVKAAVLANKLVPVAANFFYCSSA